SQLSVIPSDSPNPGKTLGSRNRQGAVFVVSVNGTTFAKLTRRNEPHFLPMARRGAKQDAQPV
ncbi:hypothetical protein MZK49_18125, partial [Ensifer sesbaniae]|uniref:hypothetical protein n=1 Tax=Ensifer sesbaniae TaxID=1214071 RepID=UPI0020012C35|nr:hypothetical protein [Ensifer sesbaniae]